MMIPVGPLLSSLLVCLAPSRSGAEVRVFIPASAAERAARAPELADTERHLRSLLLDPVERRERADGLALHSPDWRPENSARREPLFSFLRGKWAGLRIEEDAPPAPTAGAAVAPGAGMPLSQDRLRRITGAGATRDSQARFYDGASASKEAAAVVVAGKVGPVAGGHAARPGAKTLRVTAAIPPPASKAAAKPSISKGAWEAVKGAGGVVKDMISWKGLAVAAGAVVLVTVVPVTIYGLLAVGAAVGGWTVGKAILHGTAAYKAGDTERFNAACREFGRGALSLGLALYGARFAPTSLKPHIPRTGGEWKALSTSMDDESVVLFSLFRGKGSAAHAETPPARPPSE